ncbi:MAG TPA: alpha-amylase family glycosyl hydrolase [Pseudonocardiaceae bacterium]
MTTASRLDDDPNWWRNEAVYQVYVRSFADSDGDGVGDLDGIRSRLGYLELLGVGALWLTPFYRSPMADHGYDVADPRDVDPLFGDLAAFDALVAEAHALGLRVLVDLVPNHTSSEHEWFRAALRAGPGSAERDRYLFREGRGLSGELPPNNWPSVFGGPAWTRVPDGQWYLHLFAPEQPDLNWANPEVWSDLERTLRFWLDRGVDGFRIDVAHGMAKPAGLPDFDLPAAPPPGSLPDDDLRFDAEGVHDIHRMVRKVLDEYPGRVAIGEIWVKDNEAFARYVRPDELQLGFNFRLVAATFDAAMVRDAIEQSLAAVSAVGAPPTWTLSNHDVPRQVTRYGGGERGVRRARAMALVELALPGTVFLYNGEELGLPEVDLPPEVRQDPAWERTGHKSSRDGCRVPVPWQGGPPSYGFSPAGAAAPWLPMPAGWERCTVEAQLEDPGSVLSLYRSALELRRTHPAFGDRHEPAELEWYGAPSGCFAFRRKGTGLICALNTSGDAVPLPPGELLLASCELVDGALPTDGAAWLVVST